MFETYPYIHVIKPDGTVASSRNGDGLTFAYEADSIGTYTFTALDGSKIEPKVNDISKTVIKIKNYQTGDVLATYELSKGTTWKQWSQSTEGIEFGELYETVLPNWGTWGGHCCLKNDSWSGWIDINSDNAIKSGIYSVGVPN